MNTTTLRAGMARIRSVLAAIDWQEALSVTADGLRILWSAAQLITAAIAMLAVYAYEHRQQIRDALVAAVAAAYVAAERTYRAGQWTRRQLEALSSRSAALVAAQPLPAMAPITASIEAIREALARLIARLYPVVAA